MVSHAIITVGKEEFIKAWFAVVIRSEVKGVLCLNTQALPLFFSPSHRQFGIDIGAVNNLRLCLRGPSQESFPSGTASQDRVLALAMGGTGCLQIAATDSPHP